jgi:hypothetical protein
MTYSYFTAVPLLIAYSTGFAVIKYTEGFIALPGFGVIPAPYFTWAPSSRNAIFPLYLAFSFSWGLEMVTHLEELCFWLFLINASTAQQDWFHSMYFKTWALGSVLAVTYMPLVTIFTRSDPLKCEAYTFLAGSLGSLSLTLWFLPVLWTFPSFLKSLRREGVDTPTVVRLTKFHELNTVRIIFRFLFVLPLLVLAIDGVRPHQHVNESMFWTDILPMIAGIGVVVSSAITLVASLSLCPHHITQKQIFFYISQIFFPRSIEGEISARDAAKERSRLASASRAGGGRLGSKYMSTIDELDVAPPPSVTGTYLLTSSPVRQGFNELPGIDFGGGDSFLPGNQKYEKDMMMMEPPPPPPVAASRYNNNNQPSHQPKSKPLRPNRRQDSDIELGGMGTPLTDENLSRHNLRSSKFNPLVHNFTSPIDLAT